MSYELEFEEHALKEFKKLGAPLREQFKKKLNEILVNPHIPANRLGGMPDCYKIKLRSAGYRLVYQAIDEEVIVLVLAVGKRDRSEVYNAAKARL
ncbi:type II toxin-antitoxin system RelE family toxin [Acerihabitans arboris]|uniref:Type II toxin-antitoxin system mRNA interferase toxin, RelE/StbE family n=1 Tax=Acerihabitans arboris TaxID=2691583 RepID=A0A845SJM5_9GAMM|nr:type II toxin-antitoxin system RelE/ParE family toxin [Acerihabitans arboris]NDL64139.1 type II toxin-antitoxin system mRNA interferase toxin, RelE/StbE family [Acerihabitans arboris]